MATTRIWDAHLIDIHDYENFETQDIFWDHSIAATGGL